MQRVGVLIELPHLLRSRGIDPETVLNAAGVDPAALDSAENFITFDRYAALCCSLVEMTGDDSFTMKVGSLARPHHLGLLGSLMTVAPTLGAAIGDLVTNHPRYVRGGGPYLIDLDTGHTLVGYRTHLQDLLGKRQLLRGTVAFGYNVFKEISGIAPEFVHISLPKPADVSAYRAAFPRAKVIFDSPHYGLAYARQALDKPLPHADAQRHRELERGVEEMWRLKQPDIRERVLRAMVPAIFSGTHNLRTTAQRLGLTPRALNRQLQAQGITFRELLKAARFEMASQLLMDTNLPIHSLAELLGYSEISAFTRFFTHLTGVPPTEWRKLKTTVAISA